jgi:general secretion pathway protein G
MKTQIANRQRRSRGFTLIEIMVVVVIIGLLAAIVVPNLVSNIDEAAITRTKTDIRVLENSVNLFRIDNYRYPTEEEGLEILLGNRTGINDNEFKQYMSRLPIDPWDNDYLYANPGEHGTFDIFTYGADEKEGGDGINADIGNWNLE